MCVSTRGTERFPYSPRLNDAQVHMVVPTGNFGNALASYYAKEMGLPIARIVLATNANDILHRFISAGDYSARTVEPTLGKSSHYRDSRLNHDSNTFITLIIMWVVPEIISRYG